MLKKSILATLIASAGLVATDIRAEGWLGFMNVFENDAGAPGAYVFGAPWGVPDMQTTVVISNVGTYIGDQLLLAPNFNTYAENPGDAFWRDNDGAGPGGNKFMEANTYVEFPGLDIPMGSFAGTVNSYTLDPAYEALAFIKVLNPDAGWSLDVFETHDLVTGGSFFLAADLADHQGKVLQYGFLVSGVNANPDLAAALGSVDVTVIPEPSTYALILAGALGALVWFRRRK